MRVIANSTVEDVGLLHADDNVWKCRNLIFSHKTTEQSLPQLFSRAISICCNHS